MSEEAPKRLAPTIETLRALFAKSGNQCAFPDCTHSLVDDDNEFIGQVCHIEDAMYGARFNEKMSNEERRGYDNLILFCYRHHIKTNDVSKYPVEKLKEIKFQNEIKFQTPFQVSDITLITLFNDLKSIKEDTTEILKTVIGHNQQLEDIKAFIFKSNETHEYNKSDYVREIESIMKLRDSNNHKAALKLFENFKSEKWDNLNGLEKYKVLANIGIIHLELNDQKKAAEYFIESYRYNPDDEKAMGFAAIGYAVLNKKIKATLIIEKIIAINSKNSNAYQAFITLNRDNMDFSEILEKIPIELRDTPEISYALGGLARHKNDFDTSIYWLQKAIESSYKNNSDFHATLGSTLLESVSNPFQIITGQIDNEIRNKIKYSIELLTTSWNKVKDTDLRNSRAWLLVNRGIAKKFLKDFEGSFDDIKMAASINEGDYYTLRHLSIVAFETGKLDYALEILDQLQSIESKENQSEVAIDFFKAEVLFKKQEFSQVIEILKTLIKETTSQENKDIAQSKLISTYVAIHDFKNAKEFSLSIIENRSNYLRGYIDASKVFSIMDNNDQALSLLNTAFEQLNHDTNHADIQELAYEFYKFEDFRKSIELLERITKPGIYSELSSNLLRAYYKAGENAKALELIQSIRSNYGPIDIVTEIQSNIYESIDDLPKAIDICEEYLNIYPDDQLIQIRLANIYYRLKDKDKVKEILSRLKVLGELPIDILYKLARLNILVGEFKNGLKVAFEFRRKFSDSGNAHSKYVQLFSEFRTLTDHVRDIHQVGEDTAVKLKDESGETQWYYILQNTKKLLNDELLLNDTLVIALLGKEVGDTVIINRDFGEPRRFEIVSILSKYIYAFQESIELINRKFIDIKGFTVLKTKDSGNIKEDLRPIFDLLDEAEKFEKQIQEVFNKKPLTIGILAQLRQQNPIKVWSNVVGSNNSGINSMSGLQKEIETAHFYLDNGKGIVLELVSLLTLLSISKLELLEVLPNKKVISRSTIETIDELLREFKGIGSDGYMSLGKVKGEYVRDCITNEQIESSIAYYEKVLKWIEQYCDILPCNIALTMNALEKERMDSTFGRPFVDAILIAKEYDFLLLADEEILRKIALNDFQVIGFPSYALLSYCLKVKHIDYEIFDKVVSKLILLNYKYLPVDSQILFECADMSRYMYAFPFDLALKTLDFSISSEDSSIYVATDFFYKLYLNGILPQVRLNLIIPTLNALVNGRNFIVVIQKLLILIEKKFVLLLIQKDEIRQIINDFIKARKQNNW
ncbi:MAG: hypothetical protein NTY07_02470 [Bacteroidia bacterium]|nr:hypothetical protein [Bacteroidia bacterium]